MAKNLVRDFRRLRVLTNLDLRQRMDALVQDLSHALEMEEGGGSHMDQSKGGSHFSGSTPSLHNPGPSGGGGGGGGASGGTGHTLKGKRRNWKRRSKSAGSLAPLAAGRGATAYHSDDSSSSLGEVAFSQEKSSMHQTDSDEGGASAQVGGASSKSCPAPSPAATSRHAVPNLPMRAWKTVVAMAAAAAAHAATTGTAVGTTTTTTTGGSLAESDSLNEALAPIKGQARRKRKFKRMAVDEDVGAGHRDGAMLLPPPPGMGKAGLKVKKKKGRGREENMAMAEGDGRYYEAVVCGKRKRSARERSVECERGSPIAGGVLEMGFVQRMDTSDGMQGLHQYSGEMVSSSSLSSSESDAGVYTNDEGREGDDEQSDWFYEPGPVSGMAGVRIHWDEEEDSHAPGPTQPPQAPPPFPQAPPPELPPYYQLPTKSGREIRAGRRHLHERRPGFSIVSSANEKLSRFLRDPGQSELRLHPMKEGEADKLGHLAALYSLHLRQEQHRGLVCPVLTKTGATTRVDGGGTCAGGGVVGGAAASGGGTAAFGKRQRRTPPPNPASEESL